jgi:ABC-type polar amino acid transport system ATPase subunit
MSDMPNFNSFESDTTPENVVSDEVSAKEIEKLELEVKELKVTNPALEAIIKRLDVESSERAALGKPVMTEDEMSKFFDEITSPIDPSKN